MPEDLDTEVRPVTENEAESLINAIDLLRELSYDEKADDLSDLLEAGLILVDLTPEPVGYLAETLKFTIEGRSLSLVFLRPGLIVNGVIDRCNPRIISLTAVLLHEAKHVQCHGEKAAWGATVDVLRRMNRKFNEIFEDCTDEQRRRLRREKERQLLIARRVLREYARMNGRTLEQPSRPIIAVLKDLRPDPYIRDYPEPITDSHQARMQGLALAILSFFVANGQYPKSGNKNLVKALQKEGVYRFKQKDLNKKGEVIDLFGNPYVYRCPGRIYKDKFDLYSTGASGKDSGGEGDNILCLLDLI